MLNAEDLPLKVEVSQGQNTGFQMKTHPNIDKALYSSQSVLGLKDPQRPFPAGSPLGILKWRMQVMSPSLRILLNARAEGYSEFLDTAYLLFTQCRSFHSAMSCLCACEFVNRQGSVSKL